jgi:hypothetical protein
MTEWQRLVNAPSMRSKEMNRSPSCKELDHAYFGCWEFSQHVDQVFGYQADKRNRLFKGNMHRPGEIACDASGGRYEESIRR